MAEHEQTPRDPALPAPAGTQPQPQAAPDFETLAFYFPAADAQRALLNLHWGETLVQVPIENIP